MRQIYKTVPPTTIIWKFIVLLWFHIKSLIIELKGLFGVIVMIAVPIALMALDVMDYNQIKDMLDGNYFALLIGIPFGLYLISSSFTIGVSSDEFREKYGFFTFVQPIDRRIAFIIKFLGSYILSLIYSLIGIVLAMLLTCAYLGVSFGDYIDSVNLYSEILLGGGWSFVIVIALIILAMNCFVLFFNLLFKKAGFLLLMICIGTSGMLLLGPLFSGTNYDFSALSDFAMLTPGGVFDVALVPISGPFGNPIGPTGTISSLMTYFDDSYEGEINAMSYLFDYDMLKVCVTTFLWSAMFFFLAIFKYSRKDL